MVTEKENGDSFHSFLVTEKEATFSTFLEPHPVLCPLSPFRLFFTPLSFAPLRSGSEEFAGIIPSEKMFKCTALLRCLPPFVLRVANFSIRVPRIRHNTAIIATTARTMPIYIHVRFVDFSSSIQYIRFVDVYRYIFTLVY